MKHCLLFLVLCSAGLCPANAAHAKPQPLTVSKNNFSSLQFRRRSFMRPRFENYTIRNRKIFQTVKIPKRFSSEKPPLPQSRTLSLAEWTELISQLKKLNVPAIAGRYSQRVTDASSQSLELTLFDASRRKRTFSISSYGHKAPASFYNFQDYFNTLIKRKFG